MVKGIIGKKVGMTQLFDESGKVIPVTVIEAGPCTVVQKKTVESDGYQAVQLGFGEVSAYPQLKLRLLVQAPVALPRRFAVILCPNFVVISR